MGNQFESAIDKLHIPNTEKLLGLHNLGNTCYCNATLQALFFCQSFRKKIIEYFAKNRNNTELSETPTCALGELFFFMENYKTQTGSVVPKEFIQKLKKASSLFQTSEQQDAAEFLSYLLNTIHETVVKEKNNGKLINNSSSHISSDTFVPTTIIDEIFKGFTKNEIRCLECETVTYRIESFLHVPLPITVGHSLSSSVEAFSALENFDGSNKFYCSHCRHLNEANKTSFILLGFKPKNNKLSSSFSSSSASSSFSSSSSSSSSSRSPSALSSHTTSSSPSSSSSPTSSSSSYPSSVIYCSPSVLILQLKRFSFNTRKFVLEKDSSFVDIQEEIQIPWVEAEEGEGEETDEDERVEERGEKNGDREKYGKSESSNGDEHKNKGVSYRLCAMVVHLGMTLGGGHYVAVVRAAGHWFIFNDSSVDPLEEKDLPNYYGIKPPQQQQQQQQQRKQQQQPQPRNVARGTAYLLFYEKVMK